LVVFEVLPFQVFGAGSEHAAGLVVAEGKSRCCLFGKVKCSEYKNRLILFGKYGIICL
jgi:hypothetical protein